MNWNVYINKPNSKQIEIFNVFDHPSFRENVTAILKKNLTFQEFEKKIRSELYYYFGGKVEWEVVITSFPPHLDKKEQDRLIDECRDFFLKNERYPVRQYVVLDTGLKIDVYQQVMLNWQVFLDYVWKHSSVKEKEAKTKEVLDAD